MMNVLKHIYQHIVLNVLNVEQILEINKKLKFLFYYIKYILIISTNIE
jgi:hypothetical protein